MVTVRICHGEPDNLVGKVLVLTTGDESDEENYKITCYTVFGTTYLYHEVGERS